ncbi:monocarboxylate transporter 12-like [Asterias amurensis]|uniref:monocarboxylate transporter 12-like n=1 Tax=Asterias amurensis TaxID=7602 RepID=UPI003AB2490D
MSFANILTKVEIARRFEHNYATANGIAQTGNPLGLILVAPLIKLCLDTYGWRGAFLVLGGLNLNLVVCGALLGKPSIETNRESFKSVPSCEEGTTTKSSTLRNALVILKSRFGISVCLRLTFWIPAVLFICNTVVDAFWSIYYVNHVEVKGFTSDDAVVFITAAGVAKLFSKIGFGILVDRGILKLRPALAIVIIVPMICLIIDPWMDSYWLLLINVVIFAAFSSALASLNDVYTRELIGRDLIACAFSWMGLAIGVITFCSGFLPGWILEQTGSYDLAFVVTGCLYIPPLVALCIESFLLQRNT